MKEEMKRGDEGDFGDDEGGDDDLGVEVMTMKVILETMMLEMMLEVTMVEMLQKKLKRQVLHSKLNLLVTAVSLALK